MSAKASEIKLLERVANGESQAFAQLYTCTSHQLHQYLVRITGGRKKADDLLVSTYREAWYLAGQYNQKLSPIKWLIVLARKFILAATALDADTAGLSESGVYSAAVLDRQKAFAKVMESLPVQVREPLGLVLLPGYTYYAMAEVLRDSIDSVKSDVFKAKQSLNEALKQVGIKKHVVSKSNILRELIPLYINGALAGKHKKAFERSLKNDQYLKQEYLEFYEIEAYFDQMEIVSEQHLEQLFNKIKNLIDDLVEEKTSPQKQAVTSGVNANFLYQVLSSARIGWGLAILQFIILVIGLVFIVPQYPNQAEIKLNTMQLLQQQAQAKARAKKINVVFQNTANQNQIRDLLLSINAQMDSGPTDIGLYTISVAGNEALVSQVLDTLRKSEHIVLAEPAY
ncbi:MAG: hypothetical protein GXP08_14520 [Gammaproteobacteria bacterium]|nr:hypothetical protein [Gammaproteobacteria bacterium]